MKKETHGKVEKYVKNVAKKVLTNENGCDILFKHSARTVCDAP